MERPDLSEIGWDGETYCAVEGCDRKGIVDLPVYKDAEGNSITEKVCIIHAPGDPLARR